MSEYNTIPERRYWQTFFYSQFETPRRFVSERKMAQWGDCSEWLNLRYVADRTLTELLNEHYIHCSIFTSTLSLYYQSIILVIGKLLFKKHFDAFQGSQDYSSFIRSKYIIRRRLYPKYAKRFNRYTRVYRRVRSGITIRVKRLKRYYASSKGSIVLSYGNKVSDRIQWPFRQQRLHFLDDNTYWYHNLHTLYRILPVFFPLIVHDTAFLWINAGGYETVRPDIDPIYNPKIGKYYISFERLQTAFAAASVGHGYILRWTQKTSLYLSFKREDTQTGGWVGDWDKDGWRLINHFIPHDTVGGIIYFGRYEYSRLSYHNLIRTASFIVRVGLPDRGLNKYPSDFYFPLYDNEDSATLAFYSSFLASFWKSFQKLAQGPFSKVNSTNKKNEFNYFNSVILRQYYALEAVDQIGEKSTLLKEIYYLCNIGLNYTEILFCSLTPRKVVLDELCQIILVQSSNFLKYQRELNCFFRVSGNNFNMEKKIYLLFLLETYKNSGNTENFDTIEGDTENFEIGSLISILLKRWVTINSTQTTVIGSSCILRVVPKRVLRNCFSKYTGDINVMAHIYFYINIVDMLFREDLGGELAHSFSDLSEHYTEQAQLLLFSTYFEDKYEKDLVTAVELTKDKWDEYRYRFNNIPIYYGIINIYQRYYASVSASTFQVWQRMFDIFESSYERFSVINSFKAGVLYAFRLQNCFIIPKILETDVWVPINKEAFVIKKDNVADDFVEGVIKDSWYYCQKQDLENYRVTVLFGAYNEDWSPFSFVDEDSLKADTILQFYKKVINYGTINRVSTQTVVNCRLQAESTVIAIESLLSSIRDWSLIYRHNTECTAEDLIEPLSLETLSRWSLRARIGILNLIESLTFTDVKSISKTFKSTVNFKFLKTNITNKHLLSKKLKEYFKNVLLSSKGQRLSDYTAMRYQQWAHYHLHGLGALHLSNDRNLGHISSFYRFLQFYTNGKYKPWIYRIRFYQFIGLVVPSRVRTVYQYRRSKTRWKTALTRTANYSIRWINKARKKVRVWHDLRTSLKQLGLITNLLWENGRKRMFAEPDRRPRWLILQEIQNNGVFMSKYRWKKGFKHHYNAPVTTLMIHNQRERDEGRLALKTRRNRKIKGITSNNRKPMPVLNRYQPRKTQLRIVDVKQKAYLQIVENKYQIAKKKALPTFSDQLNSFIVRLNRNRTV